MNYIMALDPGRDKCGVAVLNGDGQVEKKEIVETGRLGAVISGYVKKYGCRTLVMGNGTTSKKAKQLIKGSMPDLKIIVIDEYNTTQLAKQEYWRERPPKGWRCLIPKGMLVPPEPVDDFVAVILGRRYLDGTADIVQRNC